MYSQISANIYIIFGYLILAQPYPTHYHYYKAHSAWKTRTIITN